MLPRITIVTPSFNQARYLESTIRSVLAQRDQVHEYFVYDGASTDGSEAIIRKYANQLDYWVSRPDRGQSDAIGQGFARATGDVLYWLNSDDVLLPGALARVRQAFSRSPDWASLTGYHVGIDADDRIIYAHRAGPESPSMARRFLHLHVCQQTWFLTRKAYERIGPIDIEMQCAMDIDLWFRLFADGAIWGHVPAYLGAYRWHAETKNSTRQDRYDIENALLRHRMPQFKVPPWRVRLGQALGLVSDLATFRKPLAWRDTHRWAGTRLSDVFPQTPASHS